jgi:uncharacterized protein
MSAANASAPSPSLQEEMRAHEPSMEEILASIRRIIADDESFPAARQRDERRRREVEPSVDDAAAPAGQSAYPAPVLEPAVLEIEAEAPPVAEIRQLRESLPEPERVDFVEEIELEAQLEADEGLARHADEAELSEALVPAPAAAFEEEAVVDHYDAADAAPLVSPDAAASIATHFEALATSMFINDSGLLQKYAHEMLRPMLKQWLDDNLPVIVERLVRAEIERVARGGRR